jgi:rhodanese-related sulfurtransferase
MRLITGRELKERLDRGDELKLVMTYHEWAFRAKRIPGSVNVFNREMVADVLKPGDEIVVYCVSRYCDASRKAYRILTENGFNSVWRFVGGLKEWEEEGFPLEGEDPAKAIEVDDQYKVEE